MEPISNYDDYLSRRGQLLAAIEAAAREVAQASVRPSNERDGAAVTLATHTQHAAQEKLAELDAAWRAIEGQRSAATATATLPDREAQLERVEAAMHARAIALRKIERAFAKHIQPAVADYEAASTAVHGELRSLKGRIDLADLSAVVRERGDEAKIVRAIGFGAGLWGVGTQQDAFDYHDRDLNSVVAQHTKSIVGPVRLALFEQEEA